MEPAAEKRARPTELKSDHLYYGIIALVVLCPLVFFPSLINLYRLPKTTFISLLVTAMIWLWLFLLIQEKEQKTTFPLAIPLIVYLGVSVFSLLNATNPYEGLFALSQEAIYIFLFWLVVNHIRTSEQVERILLWTISSAVIVSLIGIYQAFGGDIPWLVRTGGIGSTFGNKSPAAQYILLTLPFPYFFLLSATERDRQRLFAVCAAITTTYLVYTGTRASWIGGLAATLTIFIFLRLKRARLQPQITHLIAQIRSQKMLLGCVILFVVGMNLIPPFLAGNWSAQRVLPRLATGLELEQDTSFRERLAMWSNTLGMFKDHPLLGVGKGNFKIFYPLYATRKVEGSVFSPEVQPREAHNDYVQLLAETGILGFVSFIFIMLLIGVRLWKSIGENNDPRSMPTLLSLSFSFIALLVNAFLDFPFEHPISKGFFWLFAGLLWGSCENNSPSDSDLSSINRKWSLSPRWGRISVGFLSALSILFATSHLNFLRAEFYFSRGTMWFYEKREGPPQPAERDLKTALYLNPTSYRPPYLLGLLYIWEQRYDEAIKANLQALRRHPYYINAYNNLGVAFASVGKSNEAEWAWKKALEIWPDHSEARNNLATVYAVQGKQREAIALFKESLIRNPQDEEAKQKLRKLLGQNIQNPKVKSP